MNSTSADYPWYKKIVRYGAYLGKHKWYVFLEACKLGIPFRGFFHDMDKLRPSMLGPYMNRFGGPQGIQFGRDKTGYYDASKIPDPAFSRALFLHLARNDHHWEWWLKLNTDGSLTPIEMSDGARRELLADMRGASRAQGKGTSVLEYYRLNGGRIRLHDDTRRWLEQQIGYPETAR
jgi:hypothetical protein